MDIWQKKSFVTWMLYPFSLLFGLITLSRKWLYSKKILRSYRSPIPILIVGNISVGGNGKTPVVIWIVEQLQQRGYRVAVISRGYGAKIKKYPQLVTTESNAELMGDEPVLIAQRTKVPVAISPNRQQSITLLLQNFKLDLIISDDGLQHYALARDIEWAVIDGVRRFGNQLLLPSGPLRELPSRLEKVQAVICNGGNAKKEEHLMQLDTDYAINLKTGEICPINDFITPCVALAGIGYPPRFFTMLKNKGIHLKNEYAFADHQHYTASQLAKLTTSDIPLLMTEKDAVKCRHFAQSNWWFIPVVAKFSPQSTEHLLNLVIPIIKKYHQLN